MSNEPVWDGTISEWWKEHTRKEAAMINGRTDDEMKAMQPEIKARVQAKLNAWRGKNPAMSDNNGWRDIDEFAVPNDGTAVLILTRHFIAEAWFDPDGYDWVCCDDKFSLPYADAIGWLPLDTLPAPPEAKV